MTQHEAMSRLWELRPSAALGLLVLFSVSTVHSDSPKRDHRLGISVLAAKDGTARALAKMESQFFKTVELGQSGSM